MSVFTYLIFLLILTETCYGDERIFEGKTMQDRNDPIHQQMAEEIYYADKNRRAIHGGRVKEEDAMDPKYQEMAEDVVRINMNIRKNDIEKVIVLRVQSYTVAGRVTTITFKVNLSNGKSSTCTTSIWVKAWENFRQVTYKCDSVLTLKLKSNAKPHGELIRDPHNPKYKKFASLAIDTYLNKLGGKLFKKEDLKKVTVVQVNVIIDSKVKSLVKFSVFTNSHKKIDCLGEILEIPWEPVDSVKIASVNCNKKLSLANKKLSLSTNDQTIVGGKTKQNPNDPEYKKMAREAFEISEYSQNKKGYTIKVIEVTTQIVAGESIELTYDVIPAIGFPTRCNSQILSQPWLHVNNFKTICQVPLQKQKLSLSANSQKNNDDDDIVGGITEQNPNDPEYKQLAIEAHTKWLKNKQFDVLDDVKVLKATTQVVAGVITRLVYNCYDKEKSFMYQCSSQILEQSWRNIKDFKTFCYSPNQELSLSANGKKNKGVPGGIIEQDPNDPRYKKLAIKAHKKWQKNLNLEKLKDVKVLKATTQVVAGLMTRLIYNCYEEDTGFVYQCSSEILEHGRKNVKEFKTFCYSPQNLKLSLSANGQQNNDDDDIAGGIPEQDPNDPKYKELAIEAHAKWLKNKQFDVLDDVKVLKATTQLVEGIITRLVYNCYDKEKSFIYQCSSQILEQPWRNIKDFKTFCYSPKNQKLSLSANGKKNNGVPGGIIEQDPNDPNYKKLAIEAHKEWQKKLNLDKLKDVKVLKATTQVVAGLITRLVYNCYEEDTGFVYQCSSEILEQGRKNVKEFKTFCYSPQNLKQDLNDPKHKNLL